jgi:DNA-binding IscR family transcriptional regulator
MKEQVLKAMQEAGKPVGASEIAKTMGLDKAVVDKAFNELKKEGKITSVLLCAYQHL